MGLEALYPARCGLCGRLGPEVICDRCEEELPLEEVVVQQAPHLAPLHMVVSRYRFDSRAAQAVKRLKFSRATCLGAPMAADIRETFDSQGLDNYEVIIPVPISPRRRRQRGFNQSEYLVAELPTDKVQPSWLTRIRHTVPQASLKADARRTNLVKAFRAEPEVKGLSVLIVDDVITTGGTGVACAQALMGAGATRVSLLSYCGERSPDLDSYLSGESNP